MRPPPPVREQTELEAWRERHEAHRAAVAAEAARLPQAEVSFDPPLARVEPGVAVEAVPAPVGGAAPVVVPVAPMAAPGAPTAAPVASVAAPVAPVAVAAPVAVQPPLPPGPPPSGPPPTFVQPPSAGPPLV